MAQFAVVETGGKQYKVAEGDVLDVERLPGDKGDEITLDRVLLVEELNETIVGAPLVADAKVSAEIVDQRRGRKIRGIKYKPKSNYKRSYGHRQELTRLRVTAISR
jgi:large subunit ribosomal protein L21